MIRSAFTLIELTLVIAIISVLALIAAPRYANSIATYRADVAARRIAADLQLVQSRARANGATGTVSFNATTSLYTLPGEKDQKLSTNTYTTRLADAPYNVSVGTVNFGGDGTLLFNGYGIPDSGGSITVRSGPVTRTVSVDANSGIVSIR